MAGFAVAEDDGAVAAHFFAVAFHDLEAGADDLGEVDFVDDEEVGLGDTRAAFAGDFVAAGDVDDVDGEVGEFAGVVGGEVVAAGFDEEEFEAVVEANHELFEGVDVDGDVFANGGVGAAAGFDAEDAVGGEGFVADEEFGVLAGEDVVGDDGDVGAVAVGAAEGEEEGGFAGSDGAADADGEGAGLEVAVGEERVAFFVEAGVVEVFVGVAVVARVGGVRMGVGVFVGVAVLVRMVVGVGVVGVHGNVNAGSYD